MVTEYFHLYFNELHATQFHLWRKSQEPNNNQTPPCDVPWRSIRVQYLQTEHFTPSPVPKCKSFFFHNNAAAQTHLSLKGASKWKKFSLISAHRCYAETPHEFNNLTSFLKRIWIKLSKSVSQLKIGLFLCVLDQNLCFMTVWPQQISQNCLVTHQTSTIQLTCHWSLTKPIQVTDFVLSLTKPKKISRHFFVTHKTYSSNWLCFITHQTSTNQQTWFGHSQKPIQVTDLVYYSLNLH